MSKCFREELLEIMREVRTVDCHSHTILKREYYKAGQLSLFNLMSYYDREVHSATGKGIAQLCADAKSDGNASNP